MRKISVQSAGSEAARRVASRAPGPNVAPGGVAWARWWASRDATACGRGLVSRSEEHTSELQSQSNIVCRLLLEKKNEAIDTMCQYVIDRGYDMKFAIEPKPNEPRGDIRLP